MLKLKKLFEDSPNERVLLSGNEAFARGIFEAGVSFAANYPGTPLSDIGDTLNFLSEIDKEFIHENALNEKVALESCIGASWAGVRSVAMFKHLGLNVAADPLLGFPCSGTNGGMLILCGGDLGISSSTNAQDNRLYSLHTKIPILEPATVQECKDFIIEGLRISELYQIPVYIHTNTQICHGYGIVRLGKIEKPKKGGYFKKQPDRYVNTLRRALASQKKYFEIISQVAKNKKLFYLLNNDKLLQTHGKNEEKIVVQTGIITSGVCYGHVIQACRKLRINPPILKLGLIFPINKVEICAFANKYILNKLLIVEELEPFIESFSKSVFCNFCEAKRDLEIHGKDFLPNIGELNTEIIMRFFTKHFNIKNNYILEEIDKKEIALAEILPNLPIRQPTFCPQLDKKETG